MSGSNDLETTAGFSGRNRQTATGPTVCVALTVMAHPNLERVGAQALLHGLLRGESAAVSRMEPLFFQMRQTCGQPLDDPFLSRHPLWLKAMPEGGVCLQTKASRTKVLANGRDIGAQMVFSAREVSQGVVLSLADRLVLLLHYRSTEVDPSTMADMGLLGISDAIGAVRADIQKVAKLDIAVLLRGETGTGKELAARAIHQKSHRHKQPFIAVNLGAIPTTLVAAELFGTTKGAYTGACQAQAGFFQKAHGGTLFLDELGEAPPEIQATLLRVLETGEIYAVGSQTAKKTNVRIIAATDANLDRQIADGAFKAPLLHRLCGYEISLPPLRQRREDLGLLTVHFARKACAEAGIPFPGRPAHPRAAPWLPAGLAALLSNYHWPGNVRQLANTVRQLVIHAGAQACLEAPPRITEALTSTPLDPSAPTPANRQVHNRRARPRAYRKVEDVSDAELVDVLRRQNWDVKASAEQLGVARSSLYLRIRAHPTLCTAADLSEVQIREAQQRFGGVLEAMARDLQVSVTGLRKRVRELGPL